MRYSLGKPETYKGAEWKSQDSEVFYLYRQDWEPKLNFSWCWCRISITVLYMYVKIHYVRHYMYVTTVMHWRIQNVSQKSTGIMKNRIYVSFLAKMPVKMTDMVEWEKYRFVDECRCPIWFCATFMYQCTGVYAFLGFRGSLFRLSLECVGLVNQKPKKLGASRCRFDPLPQMWFWKHRVEIRNASWGKVLTDLNIYKLSKFLTYMRGPNVTSLVVRSSRGRCALAEGRGVWAFIFLGLPLIILKS
jgi:hypothetical protein